MQEVQFKASSLLHRWSGCYWSMGERVVDRLGAEIDQIEIKIKVGQGMGQLT